MAHEALASVVGRDALKEAIDGVVLILDRPCVDLGPLLGSVGPIRVGLDDMHELLASGEPAFHFAIGPASVTVRRQDGGMLGELSLTW